MIWKNATLLTYYVQFFFGYVNFSCVVVAVNKSRCEAKELFWYSPFRFAVIVVL